MIQLRRPAEDGSWAIEERDPLRPLGITPKVPARHRHLAGVRFQQTRDHGDRGGFPRAVGSEQAVDFTFTNFEIDLLHRPEFAERLGQPQDFKYRHVDRLSDK